MTSKTSRIRGFTRTALDTPGLRRGGDVRQCGIELYSVNDASATPSAKSPSVGPLLLSHVSPVGPSTAVFNVCWCQDGVR